MQKWLLLAAAFALGACAVGGDDDPDNADFGDDTNPDEGDVPAVTPSDPAALAGAIHNPVIVGCADPGVMRDGSVWYTTCTGGAGGNHFPIYKSTDLLHWTLQGYIFPAGTAPAWGSGNWWAPELHHVPGGVAAYFTAKNGTHNAIGVATAPTVGAAFTNPRPTPIVARDQSIIDAHTLISVNGSLWIYFKREGDPDTIWAHQLAADGKSMTAGASTRVLSVTEGWEKGVVEAPWVVHLGDYYYLFYSGAAYCNSSYAVGVARSKHPLGPFVKKGAPILKSGSRWVGPGHNSITTGPDGQRYIVYHAYQLSKGTPACGAAANDNNTRDTLIDRVVLEGGWPKVISNL